jgi:hypothetical protein
MGIIFTNLKDKYFLNPEKYIILYQGGMAGAYDIEAK